MDGSAGRFCSVGHLAGCGAAWLARLLWEQEAPGSNPGTPTIQFRPARSQETLVRADP